MLKIHNRIQKFLFIGFTALNSTLSCLSIASASQYEFTTLAGRAGGWGSEDGQRDSARFKEPAGIARDSAGNFYIADTGNHTIRKISTAMTGTQTVTSIDAQWERVTVEEPAPPATAPSAFARVQVSLP